MKSIVDLLLIGGFTWITWQDIQCRKVFLLSYLMIFVLLAAKFIFSQFPPADFLWLNLTVTTLLAVALTFYYLLRYGLAFGGRMVSSFGAGDLLLVPILIFSFSPGNLILFFIISFIIALSYGIIRRMISKKEITIPLAGIQTLLLSLALILEKINLLDPWNDLLL